MKIDLGLSAQRLEDKQWKSETLALSFFEVYPQLQPSRWHRVIWRNYCHCCSYCSLLFGCTDLTLCCSGNTEQPLVLNALTWRIIPASGRQNATVSPVLFSCRLFPAAFVIHVLNLRVHLDAQLDRDRRKDKERLSFLIAADNTWAAEDWVWVKEEEGTSKGEMKSLDFALYVFSSMCTLHEGAVARVSESMSETLKHFPALYCMSFYLIKWHKCFVWGVILLPLRPSHCKMNKHVGV